MANENAIIIAPELWERLEGKVSGRRVLKTLSVRQPFANLIADGSKTIEVRTRGTTHRGPLLIVSSKRPDVPPAGCAVAVVNLVDSRPMTIADERAAMSKRETGKMAWVLTLIGRIEPQPVKGHAPDEAGTRVTVPHPRKEIRIGTLRNVFRQAGWNWKER